MKTKQGMERLSGPLLLASRVLQGTLTLLSHRLTLIIHRFRIRGFTCWLNFAILKIIRCFPTICRYTQDGKNIESPPITSPPSMSSMGLCFLFLWGGTFLGPSCARQMPCQRGPALAQQCAFNKGFETHVCTHSCDGNLLLVGKCYEDEAGGS